MKEYIYGVDMIGMATVALDRGLITMKIWHSKGAGDVKPFHIGEAFLEREFSFDTKKIDKLNGELRHAWNFFNKLESQGPKSDYWRECVENYLVISKGPVLITDTRFTGCPSIGHAFTKKDAIPAFETRTFVNKLYDKLTALDHYDRTHVIGTVVNTMDEVSQ